MNRNLLSQLGIGALLLVLPGCFGGDRGFVFNDDIEYFNALASETEYADTTFTEGDDTLAAPAPLSLADRTPPKMWDLTLDEAVRTALSSSKVLRDLGGTILRTPSLTSTVYGPALEQTHPRFGTEAALSAFDANLATRMFFGKNDRALNNLLVGGGSRTVVQDLATAQTQISKQAATGSIFTLRHNMEYNANNAPANLFPSAWNVNIEGEIRQPWLQGAGVEFNRIAGPNSAPGSINGIVIARLNTDVSVADFEIAVRNFVSDVENAYWDLYFAYRDLDSKIAARDASLETWRIVKSWNETGKRGGEAEKEAQAREQYFRFEEEVQNALSGRLFERTRTNNGTGGGTFRAFGGVHVAERRLRLMMGLPPTDGRLIRPSDGPVMAKVVFDWSAILPEAITRRAELRRQRKVVQRRQMELVASRNFLLPRLDTVALYRWRGFGDELLRTHGSGLAEFENAYHNLTGGDYQEWQLGVELSVPLGFRKGYAAVRNANLQVARERAVLHEQEREISHDLSDAVAEVDRAMLVTQTAFNRRSAAHDQLTASRLAWDRGKAPVDLVLDAQQRLADAQNRYYRSLVEYAIAIRNVHFEKGSLLEYNGVYLAEAPRLCGDFAGVEWSGETPLNYVLSKPLLSIGDEPAKTLEGPPPVVEDVPAPTEVSTSRPKTPAVPFLSQPPA